MFSLGSLGLLLGLGIAGKAWESLSEGSSSRASMNCSRSSGTLRMRKGWFLATGVEERGCSGAGCGVGAGVWWLAAAL